MANDPRFMDHPTAGWVLIGADGAIVSADERFAALVRATPEALTGQRFDALVAPADAARWAETRASAPPVGEWRGVFTLVLGGVERSLLIEQFHAGPAHHQLTVIRAVAVGEPARRGSDVDAELAAFHAVQGSEDASVAARAVLQIARGLLQFDWAVITRFDTNTTAEAATSTVVASYPGAMAGIERGTQWTPPVQAELDVIRSGQPTICGELSSPAGGDPPLARLTAFGMRSRLCIPLFGAGRVTGAVSLFRADLHAFQSGDGLRLERLMRPLSGRLYATTALPTASVDADAPEPAPTTASAGERTGPDEPARPEPRPEAAGATSSTAHIPGPAERDRWAADRPALSGVIEQRLGALGEMVSGVAHELNNPLTAILGYAQILPTLEGFDRDQALTTIEQEALRASRIVRNLLAFARQHRATLQPVDVEAILRRVIDVRQYSLRADRVNVATQYAGVRTVMADEYQLEQVFLNLLNNAHQAMQADGGTLSIATEQLEATVRISVSDTGPGVPAELADRIFEPFFSTRDVGSGVGLGLAIVYGLVAEHGGHVWVQPAAGGGAQFVVELPAGLGPPDGVRAGLPAAVVPEASARVLVVDDELPIRALTNEILSGVGYRVGTAASIEDAMRMLDGEPFDALVVDMRLPGSGADAFYRRVTERWPRLLGRLLWLTDEPESDLAGALVGGGKHLEKPFDASELLSTLRALLAAPI